MLHVQPGSGEDLMTQFLGWTLDLDAPLKVPHSQGILQLWRIEKAPCRFRHSRKRRTNDDFFVFVVCAAMPLP